MTTKIWFNTTEAAPLLLLKDRFAVAKGVENGSIPASAVRPRKPKGRIYLSRAYVMGASDQTDSLVPDTGLVDIDELADKLLARMIANPVFAKAVADVAMRPMFDALMKAS